jgi:DNA-binding TFAR19-related protein (PDSD5 family)
MEVLQNAEYQFPNETKMVVDKLGELMQSGELTEEIDGGKLLALFRSVDINVRMETKINVEQDGKFVSLSDKLTSKSESDESHD